LIMSLTYLHALKSFNANAQRAIVPKAICFMKFEADSTFDFDEWWRWNGVKKHDSAHLEDQRVASIVQ
jgi:hypothetical protein